MIQNLTEPEWDALLDAVNLLEQDLEQNPENYQGQRPTAAQRQAALQRATAKVRQLAPSAQ